MTTTKTEVATTDNQRALLRDFLEKQKPELSKLLPKTMTIDRFIRIALTECVKKPDLLKCTAESWALAMQTCAAQALYPDSGLGFMYLIPRENSKKRGNDWYKVWEVAAQRGYQGDIQLARNSGEVDSIYAEVAYEKDTYVVRKGLAPALEHVPYEPKAEDDGPGGLRAAYAVAKLRSGEIVWVNLWKFDVMRHKASSMSTGDNSPWTKHEAAMWKKSAIKELVKWLPKATELMQTLAREDEELRVREAIDITPPATPKVDLGPRPTGVDNLKERLGKEKAAPEVKGSEAKPAFGDPVVTKVDIEGVGEATIVQTGPPTEGEQFEAEVEHTAEMFTDAPPAQDACVCPNPDGEPGAACGNCTLVIQAKKQAAPTSKRQSRIVKG